MGGNGEIHFELVSPRIGVTRDGIGADSVDRHHGASSPGAPWASARSCWADSPSRGVPGGIPSSPKLFLDELSRKSRGFFCCSAVADSDLTASGSRSCSGVQLEKKNISALTPNPTGGDRVM